LINANRADLLACVSQRGVAAEVGHTGTFAEHMLIILKPRRLYLFGPSPTGIDALPTTNEDPNDEQSSFRHTSVLEKFDGPICSGIVEVHRSASADVLEAIPDGHFDFIHIDANHSYSACLADLRAFDVKVKRTGFITGRGYGAGSRARSGRNDVVQAVKSFVIETGYAFLALTFEESPTFVIVKDPDTQEAADFVASAVRKYLVMAQIANAEHKVFEQIEAPGTPQRYIFSFD